MHHVNWITVCKPLKEGGLGIKSIQKWNKGAQGVRYWDIASDKPSLWATWVKKGTLEAPEYGTTFPRQAVLALGSILLPQGPGLQTRYDILFLKGGPSTSGMILG
ncbi:hypothetical protein QJS10_CPA06g01725 [Acorus calamus]|uniref:Uncharacterized protein n=1 Tax=Acorus calamus TaxID=4465 RepID=A0AAV9EPB5_ACOCL|nr:hypothetical protein QJS10_CPA06g01725 [Acorus calamus]